ncbi:DMT family transporter [Pectobacterium zantedeschiae]|uniref:EamA/RhaT family transporter n=1 Tax=Pectobacterium zantedeschiae TaxID=2034769 RepID=A0A9X8JGF0_9GAMM|nr:DMT family transporter [Pectobacterium zantedeschiae]RYC40996.1 EamA family transporter [Pectobacterium zantedeschiae]RYC41755.1 EamA/RhaT family transporter [Pectobacterium zantedeschiae]RYC46423.1 EamA family transporter [Pectobacterium zantedeschiae]
MTPQTRGTIEMALAMIISGTVGWFVLTAGQPAMTVVFWRCAFGALTMLVVCGLLGLLRQGVINRKQAGIAILGGLALVLNWTLLFGAYSHASIAVATVVYHTQPFMLVGLGALFFRETLTLSKVYWLLCAFGGIVLIVSAQTGADSDSKDYLSGILMALGAAFFYAVAAAITKKLSGIPPHVLVLIQLLVGVVVLAPFAAIPTSPTASQWGILVAIGMIHTGLMSTLLYSAIQKIPTALVGALSFIYPVIAALVDWAAFGHQLDVMQLAGALAILLSAAGITFGWRIRLNWQGGSLRHAPRSGEKQDTFPPTQSKHVD